MSYLLGFIAVFLGAGIILALTLIDRKGKYATPDPQVIRTIQLEREIEVEEKEIRFNELQRQRGFTEIMNYDAEKAYQKKVRDYE